MKTLKTSVHQFLNEQLSKWATRDVSPALPVFTLSMEPGSKGSIIAARIAERLDFDLFNRDIIKEIAQSAQMSTSIIESVEKERLSGIDDFISSLVKRNYLHPDLYLEHLMKVINSIAKHGNAVIVGRGANFILPPENRFSIRVVAPLQVRINNVAELFGTDREEAKSRVMRRQARRMAFVQQAFHQDIADPLNYDMVLNTERLNVDSAAESVIAAAKSFIDSFVS